MNKRHDDWIEQIQDEKTKKSFSMNMETYGKVKQFQEKYNRNSLSEAIDDLVNIGLASVGYRTENEIQKRFDETNIEVNTIDLSTTKKNDPANTALSEQEKEDMEVVREIIVQLCIESKEVAATKQDINKAIEHRDITIEHIDAILDKLIQNGIIYEVSNGRFRPTR